MSEVWWYADGLSIENMIIIILRSGCGRMLTLREVVNYKSVDKS